MIDLGLNAKTHDLVIKDGDFVHIDFAERVAQQIKIQLLSWRGEWFLNINYGVPYLEYILTKNPNFTIIKQIFIEQIEQVDDVKSVDELEIKYDPQLRQMYLTYTVNTNYGVITQREVLGYGLRYNT